MNGIIIVDKPAGYTSFDVIAKLRGILGERRLGHGGTLDPMATGVLPVFAGNATKAVDFLPDETKRYTATVRLGILTDTGDITGTITEKSDKNCTLQELECALCSFVGAQKQVPPMYSAIKKDGKRLYELARKGKTVEREPRNIEITELRLVDFDESVREFAIDVLCSKGTYIRTLAEDIAASMGLVAALCALRRTMSAGFSETDAFSIKEIEQLSRAGELGKALAGVESAFLSLRAAILPADLARLFINGFAFETLRLPVKVGDGERVRVRDTEGNFLGLGESDENRFKKIRQFWFG